MSFPSRAACLLVMLVIAGCAQSGGPPSGGPATGSPPTGSPQATSAPTDPTDPYEATNRRILDLNFQLDDAVLRPVAVAYREVLGPWPRARIRNVLENINEPIVAANRLLQGRPAAAGQSVMRFLINSTLGLGGLFDLESIGGPPKQVADLGQTLAIWGIGDGPYLMLPLAGPSNPRELVGMIGNGFLNPLTYPLPLAANIGRGAALGLDVREQNIETIDELRNGSLDVYARLRSLWRQNRDAQLGRPPAADLEALADPGEAAPEAAPVPPAAIRPRPAEARPAQARPAQAPPVPARQAQARPGPARPIQTRTIQARPVQARPVQARPVQPRPTQPRPAQPRQAAAASPQPASSAMTVRRTGAAANQANAVAGLRHAAAKPRTAAPGPSRRLQA